MLLPYFEEEGLKSLINPNTDWQHQNHILDPVKGMGVMRGFATIPATVIPVFNCPSADGENPATDKQLTSVFLLGVTGSYGDAQTYGTTHYIMSRGVTDSWSKAHEKVPKELKGLFDINWAVPMRKITDGTSKTIALGEGADGSAWNITNFLSSGRNVPTAETNQGLTYRPWTAWICGQVAFQRVATAGFKLYEAGPYACTLEPLNKNPVTNTVAQDREMNGQYANYLGIAPSPGIKPSVYFIQANQFSTSNFRSDHPGGGNFLFADGSVHFFSEDIDMYTYQTLSTIRGDEVVDIPDE
jgi:prepilin-type processing-associated H-X9-DG protein